MLTRVANGAVLVLCVFIGNLFYCVALTCLGRSIRSVIVGEFRWEVLVRYLVVFAIGFSIVKLVRRPTTAQTEALLREHQDGTNWPIQGR